MIMRFPKYKKSYVIWGELFFGGQFFKNRGQFLIFDIYFLHLFHRDGDSEAGEFSYLAFKLQFPVMFFGNNGIAR